MADSCHSPQTMAAQQQPRRFRSPFITSRQPHSVTETHECKDREGGAIGADSSRLQRVKVQSNLVVLGMHLFGCTSQFEDYRQNFNSLLWAMTTVFQLLTVDDWNLVMYRSVAATSHWACLYFVTVIVLGRHLLLNVLVSIVVHSFKLKKAADIRARFQRTTIFRQNIGSAINKASGSDTNPADPNQGDENENRTPSRSPSTFPTVTDTNVSTRSRKTQHHGSKLGPQPQPTNNYIHEDTQNNHHLPLARSHTPPTCRNILKAPSVEPPVPVPEAETAALTEHQPEVQRRDECSFSTITVANSEDLIPDDPTEKVSTTDDPTADDTTTDDLAADDRSTADPLIDDSTADNPTSDALTDDPTTDNPTSDALTDDPTADNPTSDALTDDPTADNPTSDALTDDPTADNPTSDALTDDPTADNPTSDALTDDPTADNPTSDALTDDPTADNPTSDALTDDPTADNPTTSDPITAGQTADNPTIANPLTDCSTADNSTTVDSPCSTTAAPIADYPTTDESTADCPNTNVAKADYSTVDDPASDDEIVDDPATNDPTTDSLTVDNQQQNNNTSWIHRFVPSWCKEREEWSLFLFSPDNKFRLLCQRITSHIVFDRLMLFLIAVTCVTIAVERPDINLHGTERKFLDWSGYLFSCIFLVEMVLKMVALGLVFGSGSYCRSPWNLKDGCWWSVCPAHRSGDGSSDQKDLEEILKPLRLLRTLCPLRLLRYVPRLKQAVEGVTSSLKPLGSVSVISCVFFFVYGIVGVQLFQGKFYHCMDNTLKDVKNVTNKTECLASKHNWVAGGSTSTAFPRCFTHILSTLSSYRPALMSLFVMYSLDGWLPIMYSGIDAVAEDIEPVVNYSQWRLLYFLSFMMVSFLLLDMFISILVEKHAQVQKKLRESRKSHASRRKRVRRRAAAEPVEVPYYAHYSPVRRFIHRVCTSPRMDYCVMLIIFVSVLVMGLDDHDHPKYVDDIIEYTFFVTTALLVLEVTLKMVAFGIRRYFQNGWNRLDIVVLSVSMVSLVLSELDMTQTFPINPGILRACRVLRLAQVLKAKKIRALVKTVVKTMLHVGNLCLLFTFFFYIYSVLGVELFGDLECSEDFPCAGLHRHANFGHFGFALMALYKVTTGDNWSGILKDTLRKCHPDDKDCAGYLFWAAPLVLITFIIMVHFLLVNLVVSTIIQTLDSAQERKTERERVCEEEQPPCSTSADLESVCVCEEEQPQCSTSADLESVCVCEEEQPPCSTSADLESVCVCEEESLSVPHLQTWRVYMFVPGPIYNSNFL
ncbi:hypothetical protein WMY93_010112 [Mugilogobius chulae]|uniref:Ion transport domain-containing protein n=1 Tax=Mugilogobius chulae TaxID=88201 RepID=A0AAW0PIS2_9GOBI